jgi:hypothetical protein
MTKQFSLSTLAAALLVLGSVSAFAQDETITYDNVGNATIMKTANVEKNVLYRGDVDIEGTIEVDAAAMGMTDNKQILTGNLVDSIDIENSASIDGSAGAVTGAIGANVAAGDVNAQDNAVAIAYADLAAVMGSADASAFAYQMSSGNASTQNKTNNDATISGGSFDGASGILGANVTSGNFNMQKNNAVVAVSTGKMAEADVWAKQEISSAVSNNMGETLGSGVFGTNPVMNTASLASSFNGATGVVGINISAGTNNLQANSTTVAATIGSLGGL